MIVEEQIWMIYRISQKSTPLKFFLLKGIDRLALGKFILYNVRRIFLKY